MSSKRKKTNNLKRLARSQSKAKKANKATNNIVPTDSCYSISVYQSGFYFKFIQLMIKFFSKSFIKRMFLNFYNRILLIKCFYKYI